ncbi:MAG: TlpA family protein disulfide reductase [Bacteroidia bacterium]|nr:TlpA family protein disulfide reductase [Bacteroidia bacterium]
MSYLEDLRNSGTDTTYIVNFWATWCKPCVAELPYFEELNKTLSEEPVQIILVTLDFADDYDSRLIPFLKKKKLASRVVLLDEIKYNDWMPLIDPVWDGAIPATWVFNPAKNYHRFYREDFESFVELNEIVKPLIETE